MRVFRGGYFDILEDEGYMLAPIWIPAGLPN